MRKLTRLETTDEHFPGSARFQRAYGFAIINRARKMPALPGSVLTHHKDTKTRRIAKDFSASSCLRGEIFLAAAGCSVFIGGVNSCNSRQVFLESILSSQQAYGTWYSVVRFMWTRLVQPPGITRRFLCVLLLLAAFFLSVSLPLLLAGFTGDGSSTLAIKGPDRDGQRVLGDEKQNLKRPLSTPCYSGASRVVFHAALTRAPWLQTPPRSAFFVVFQRICQRPPPQNA